MELALDLLVSAVSVAIMILQLWATRGHFTSKGFTPGSTAIVVAVGATTAIYLLLVWWVVQPAWAQLLGLAIEVAGVWLFWATIRASREARLKFAFDTEAPAGLLTRGPYARIRHPFYASYLVVWMGWALATWSVWALVPFVVLLALYIVAARFEERLFAGTELAAAYAAYRRRAGLFWPKP